MQITGYEPVLPVWVTALWTLAMLMLAVYSFAANTRIRTGYRAGLLVLEIIAMLCAVVFLVQPMVSVSRPKEGSYRVILLSDRSGSMKTRDGGTSETRLQIQDRVLTKARRSFEGLLTGGRVDAYSFSEEAQFIGSTPESLCGVSVIPGATHIGDVLEAMLGESGTRAPLASVLLLTDGHSNGGRNAVEAAKKYATLGIPISCVGIGREAPAWDLSVRMERRTLCVARDSEFVLKATVTSSFSDSRKAMVTLMHNGTPLESIDTVLEASAERELQFKTRARVEGFQTYSVHVTHLDGDSRQDNDVDYAAVEVEGTHRVRVLFLLGGMDWEQRFLNIFASSSEQFRFASIVMTSHDTFARIGLDEQELAGLEGFPQDTMFFDPFDAVVLDTRAAPFITEKGVAAIRSFVEHKGGGLLVRGPADFLPPTLLDMMPMRQSQRMTLRDKVPLSFSAEFIYRNDTAGILTGSRKPTLPPGTSLTALGELKRAARIAISAQPDKIPLLAGLAFGAGRVAAIGLENTWRWRMKPGDEDLHTECWRHLLLWLSETGKPRVRDLAKSRYAAVGEEYNLDISVAGDDFLPAPDAMVTTTITSPSGLETSFSLEPQWEEDGRYSAPYIPPEAGEYHATTEIKLGERTLTHESWFIARQTGIENDDVSYNEGLLRDISRISGGLFFAADDASGEVPVSHNVPVMTERGPLASSWLLLGIFALASSLLWWMRRRIGLK